MVKNLVQKFKQYIDIRLCISLKINETKQKFLKVLFKEKKDNYNSLHCNKR